MKITHVKYAQALADLLEEEKDPQKTIRDFLAFLKRKKALKLLPKILKAFEEEWYRRNGIISLLFSMPKKFSSRVASLTESLAEKTGKKVLSSFKADDSLLGGVRVRFEDTLIDGSVKHRIRQFSNQLIS